MKKMAATAKCEISKLPAEILVKIFSYLDLTDRHFGVSLVCKFWLEFVRLHLMKKVVVCHQLFNNNFSKETSISNFHSEYARFANKSGPKVTKSSCNWNIVAEKSWKFVKTLILIRVDGGDLNNILTATTEFCHNIEEIQIDELCSDSQLAQNLANVLPAWVIPNGVIFNPKDPQVTLKNVTRLGMNPRTDSDFSFGWKNIFSQNLGRIDFYFQATLMDNDDANMPLAAFCENVKTFLQETHLKHIVMEDEFVLKDEDADSEMLAILKLIYEHCQSVTKFEILDFLLDQELDVICTMDNLTQLTFSMMGFDREIKSLDREMKTFENLMELQLFEMSRCQDFELIDIAQKCKKLVKFIFATGPPDFCLITFDGIKTFVQECGSKDTINHVEIYVDSIEISDQEYESLAMLVKDSFPKIVIFILNHKIL
jgi:hypothetical protein